MMKLTLWGLMVVAAAGILVAAIFILARVMVTLLLIAFVVGMVFLALKAAQRALRARKTATKP